jgi:hypothetical protein
MPSRFATPEALVEALHAREPGAREQLWEWLREPVRRLLDQLRERHDLPHHLDRLTRHALHAVETGLRTRPPTDFRGLSVPAFLSGQLLQVARQAVVPAGEPDAAHLAPEPLPETKAYACETVFLPSERIGSFRFGGDWYGGRLAEDGTLWLIVADITGHGYAAYLLANALPAVWRKCWADAPHHREPGELLAAMHDLLSDCLPEDVYVECTLLRLDPGGRATVAPAGGSRLLLWQERRPPALLKLRGLWLGLERPTTEDQHTCVLRAGDELLVGTDGVFDQLLEHAGPDADLARLVADDLHRGSLLEAVREALRRALAGGPQKDDITLVTVRRR